MGNGPSLRNVDFKDLDVCDTFGLNGAYRGYEKIGWYPTYHGSFDELSLENYEQDFVDLIESGNIQRHFYRKNISNNPRFQYINMHRYGVQKTINRSPEDFKSFTDTGNSGTNACSIGICLGYKRILLVGVDVNYVERIQESFEVRPGWLGIKKQPEKNPNYWFDDYQRPGDIYNLPRVDQFLKPTWRNFAVEAKNLGVTILNCSPISELDCFEKVDLKKALSSS